MANFYFLSLTKTLQDLDVDELRSISILRVDSSQYADIQSEGARFRAVNRCLWEAGPSGQQPVYPSDKMNTEVPSDFRKCWYGSSRLWYSNGPPDCVYEFVPPFFDAEGSRTKSYKPWNPNTWEKDGWGIFLVELDIECSMLDRCRKKCPMDAEQGRRPPYQDWRIYTTVLQMVGPLATTTRVGGSDISTTVQATYQVTATRGINEPLVYAG